MVGVVGQSGTCRLQSPIQGVGMMERPASRSLNYWPDSGATMGGEGSWDMPRGLGPRE